MRKKWPKPVRTVSKWFIALALLPAVWASFAILVKMGPSLMEEGWQVWWIYLGGIVIYFLAESVFKKPMWFYVVGHELTHAISGILSGARVHHFRASSSGGEVRLSKSNFFIALSPYIIPFYALLVIALYAILGHWVKSPYLTYGFQFLIGFALAFHISLTYTAVHKRQPDLKILGLFLSTALIGLGNAIILGLFCVALFEKTPTLKEYFWVLKDEALLAWNLSVQFIVSGVQLLIHYLAAAN